MRRAGPGAPRRAEPGASSRAGPGHFLPVYFSIHYLSIKRTLQFLAINLVCYLYSYFLFDLVSYFIFCVSFTAAWLFSCDFLDYCVWYSLSKVSATLNSLTLSPSDADAQTVYNPFTNGDYQRS